MPGRFRFTPADIRNEGAIARPEQLPEVVNYETKMERVVRDYEPRKIVKPGTGHYQFTRDNFGPMAASDSGRVIKARQDSRFRVSELVREPLAIDAEERRAFEEQVRTRVDALATETFESAKKSGFEEGLKLGREEALAEARASATEMLNSLAGLVDSVEAHRQRLLEQQERFLMELVLKIARKVCLKELTGDTGYIGRMLHSMVEQSGVRENIRIRLSMQDLDAVSALRAELVARWGELKNLTIEPSAHLSTGSCELETEVASYSASLDSQLEAIHESIFAERVRESS